MYLLDARSVDQLKRLVDFQERVETYRYSRKLRRKTIKDDQLYTDKGYIVSLQGTLV